MRHNAQGQGALMRSVEVFILIFCRLGTRLLFTCWTRPDRTGPMLPHGQPCALHNKDRRVVDAWFYVFNSLAHTNIGYMLGSRLNKEDMHMSRLCQYMLRAQKMTNIIYE